MTVEDVKGIDSHRVQESTQAGNHVAAPNVEFRETDDSQLRRANML